jgi:transcription antitermination factor NusG
VKELELPLFSGYVFCRFDPNKRLPVLTTPGVSYIVGVGRTPVPVSEAEIHAVRVIVDSGITAEPWPFLEAGNNIRIEDGPLFGIEGIMLKRKQDHRIVVSVTLLRRSVAVELDARWVRPAPLNTGQTVRSRRDPERQDGVCAVAAGSNCPGPRSRV